MDRMAWSYEKGHGAWSGPQTPRPRRVGWLGFIIFGLCAAGAAHGQGASEYQVKAAYLYNFAKLTKWPEKILPDGPTPLVIGVLAGDDEFVDVLSKTVAGRSIGPHPVAARRVADDDLNLCHVVFIRSSAGHKRTQAIIAAAPASALLVGEDEAFLREGGMINLLLANGTVRFEIDQQALERSSIRVSAELFTAANTGHRASHEPAEDSRPDPVDESRRLRFSTPPEYPEVARKMNIRGMVQLELIVARDGAVKDATVIGGHPVLADAMLKAVKAWRYEPAARESRVVVKFVFIP